MCPEGSGASGRCGHLLSPDLVVERNEERTLFPFEDGVGEEAPKFQ